ncbi:carboxymuconolactone decarboxylase family protein [Candidatus Poriferisocius sp.]|uniref:carboxymuconolactone decarboxylase family protein n=1 Tax=Candidatus Poriferisocius sp. TaxID=3101276 RepID=UPI003B01E357
MARLPGLPPADLNPEQRALYDSIAGGDRAKDASFPLADGSGALIGPFNALLYSPRVGDAVQQLGAALRFHGNLTAPVRELAILAVATYHDCEFERWAHEPIALRVGLTDEQVAALRAGTRPDLEAADLESAYDVCQSILHSRAISDDVYRQAVEALGEDLVVELMIVVGYYGMLAQLMNTFEVEPPA